MIKLHYVNAIAGAGKTFSALHWAHARVLKGGWVLVVMPTVKLIEEAVDQFRRLAPDVDPECIHGENTAYVGAEVMRALKARPEGGRILFITWSAFLTLPFFPGRQLWSVIVDEIPQAATVDEMIVPTSHVHVTDHVQLHSLGPVWGRFVVKKKGALRKVAQANDAALRKSLAPLAKILLSPNWTSFARLERYNALLSGKGSKLTVHSVLRPRIFEDFAKVTILGANFTNSLLYKLWSSQGVLFEEDERIKAGLRMHRHVNGDSISLYYGLEEPWSKSVRDRENGIIWTKLVTAASERMGGQPFGWIANKDITKDPFSGLQGERLPQVSHGLNSFQHLDNIVFLSARLPSPDHFSFLGWMGVEGEDVRRATYYEPVYQTVMRGSIRDPNNSSPKVVVVPDRAAAEFLQCLLPGSKVENLKIDLTGVSVRKPRGRPKQHQDGTGRVKHHRAQKRAEIDRLMAFIRSDRFEGTNGETDLCHQLLRELSNDNPIKEATNANVPQNALGSIFKNKYATRPLHIATDANVDDWIKALKDKHREVLLDKDDNLVFCPAVFDPHLSPDTDRGLGNVVYANGIWLDFDDGHLTHRDVANTFPDLRMLAYNSFSSTKAQPRFRLYIPTSRAVTAHEYRLLTGQIVQVMRDKGYRLAQRDWMKPQLKAHGIDLSKLHAASLFYLPCQPKDPKGKIWKDYKGTTRRPLDVDEWLENAIPIDGEWVETPADQASATDIPCDRAKVEAAKARWYTYGVEPGMGDSELFILYSTLKAANTPSREREAILIEAAQSAHSPADRTRQARRLIRSG